METTKSADGTVIAYDRSGVGPPLVVVVGAFCDRKSFVPPDSLTSVFTVYTYDRRGRGDSGDTLVLGGANSPDWFRRTVRETTAAIPGARLVVLDGQDHGAPREVITPVLTEFFGR